MDNLVFKKEEKKNNIKSTSATPSQFNKTKQRGKNQPTETKATRETGRTTSSANAGKSSERNEEEKYYRIKYYRIIRRQMQKFWQK